MGGALRRLLARYGQVVELPGDVEGTWRTVHAVVQPVLERREDWAQFMPTPLGTMRRDRFLYIGPPEGALTAPEGRLRCRGAEYEITAAQAVYLGQRQSHWWAVLRLRDAETDGGDDDRV